MASEIFIQLAIILLTAFLVSYIVRLFKQPIIIGYIFAGIIISPFILYFGASRELIEIFSHIGIAFLLFIVGLHLNPKMIKGIGTLSLIVGIIQMMLTFVVGFFVSKILGFDIITCVYIGIALMFSSTIIVTKLLSDKGHLETLYGKISIGILIIQDLVAVAVLMIISSLSDLNGSQFSWMSFAFRNLFIGGISVVVLFLLGFFVIPKFVKGVAKSQELLFLFSISWCFLISALFAFLGFSIEIGALIAGVVLSVSPYSTEISSKVRSLRDFFLIIFFIILGLKIPLDNLSSILFYAIILSIVVLVVKPIIFMWLMAMFGHAKRNNFLVGTTMAQISEFSVIVLVLGASFGHISDEVIGILTLTLVITIVLSTYMIIYSNKFYNKMSWFVKFFEKKNAKRERDIKKNYSAILFGYNRIGFGILKSLKEIKKSYLVVDHNPDTISDLQKLRISALYGDASDADFLCNLPLDKMELAISTLPDFETNLLLVEEIRGVNPDAIIIVRAHCIEDALTLYNKGASYVLTPHFLGGEYVAKMIRDLKVRGKGYLDEKDKHIKMLKERIEKGQEHPDVERG